MWGDLRCYNLPILMSAAVRFGVKLDNQNRCGFELRDSGRTVLAPFNRSTSSRLRTPFDRLRENGAHRESYSLLCVGCIVYCPSMIYRYGTEEIVIRESLPVLPVRDTIIFPYMVSPMIVGRQFSIEALQEAMVRDKQILLLAQRDKTVENPGNSDLYGFGTVARILQVMKLNNGTMKVLVEGCAAPRPSV